MAVKKNPQKKSPIQKMGKYIREIRAELRKVAWPSRSELVTSTSVVVGTVLGVSILLLVADSIFSKLFQLVL